MAASSEGTTRGRYVCLLRHSVRADMSSNTPLRPWEDRASRPYDPPIVNVKLVENAALNLQQYNIDKIFSSPFRRCFQTACILGQSLGVTTLIIDNSLGEVMTQVKSALSKSNMLEKDWCYCSEQEVKDLAKSFGFDRVVWNREENQPGVDETVGAFADRVKHVHTTLGQYCDGTEAKNNVVVTHADFLNMRLQMLLPESIYAPKECGFCVEAVDVGRAPTEGSVGALNKIVEMYRIQKIM
jgi:broad specificity phosphatase PhoE